MNSSSPSSLSSEALTSRLAELLLRERDCLLEFVFLLAEMFRRGTHLELGYDSLFTYCRKALGLPKAYAYRRSTAAELVVRFPVVADYLSDGRLCLSTLVPLKKLLELGNHLDILDRASGLTEEEVEVLVVTLLPRPVVRDVIRAVSARSVSLPFPSSGPKPVEPVSAFPVVSPAGPQTSLNGALTPPVTAITAPSRPARFELLNPETVRIAMSVGTGFRDELEEVRSALSHVVPDGNLESVLRECFRITLEVCKRRRVGAPRSHTPSVAAGDSSSDALMGLLESAEPAAANGSGPEPISQPGPDERSRHISTEIRAAVWARDAGSCSFVGRGGHRCGSRHQLEFHHRVAFALGGASTVDGLTLHCRRHNAHQARLDFGAEHLAKYSRGG